MKILFTQKIKDKFEDFKDFIKVQELPAEKIIAFGSITTGHISPKSDIDLCIVLKSIQGMQAIEDKMIITKIIENFFAEINIDIDYVFLSKEALYSKRKTLYKKILQEGIVIYENLLADSHGRLERSTLFEES